MTDREAVSLEGFCMVRAVKPDVEVRCLYNISCSGCGDLFGRDIVCHKNPRNGRYIKIKVYTGIK